MKLGYKMVKYLAEVSFLPERTGGYWEDRGYEWFAGRLRRGAGPVNLERQLAEVVARRARGGPSAASSSGYTRPISTWNGPARSAG